MGQEGSRRALCSAHQGNDAQRLNCRLKRCVIISVGTWNPVSESAEVQSEAFAVGLSLPIAPAFRVIPG